LVEAAKYLALEKADRNPLQTPVRGDAALHNLVESAGYFKIPADRGDRAAQYCYAMAVVEQNREEALRYFERAADQGLADAQFHYALMLSPTNAFEAAQYLKAAAQQSHPDAQSAYGELLEAGTILGKNLAQAFELFRLSAGQQSPFGEYNHARALAASQKPEAVEFFRLAANQGLALAQAQYGLSLSADQVQAGNYFRLSAAQGCPVGLREYGKALRTGRGVAKDIVEGGKRLGLAAEGGDKEAQSLLSLQPDYEMKLILVGDWGVGKTTLLQHFAAGEPGKGVNMASKLVQIQQAPTMVHLIDTSGQERYRSVPPAYYRNADGALVVFDLTSKKSFESLNFWLRQLQEHAPARIPIFLFGNKNDLRNREVTIQEITIFAAEHELSSSEGSALKSLDFAQPLEYLLNNCVTHRRGQGPVEPVRHDGGSCC
jgi:small GTP-binding protein